MSRFALAFSRPTVCSKITSFPTLILRRLVSNVSNITWIDFVRCSHNIKIRNEMRSSIKTISFADFSASSSERVVRLLALMESSSVVSLSLDATKDQIIVCHEDQRLLGGQTEGTRKSLERLLKCFVMNWPHETQVKSASQCPYCDEDTDTEFVDQNRWCQAEIVASSKESP